MSEIPGVVVIDVTDMRGSDDPINHLAEGTSPAMIALLRGLGWHSLTILSNEARQGNMLEATVTIVAGVTQAVLQPLAP